MYKVFVITVRGSKAGGNDSHYGGYDLHSAGGTLFWQVQVHEFRNSYLDHCFNRHLLELCKFKVDVLYYTLSLCLYTANSIQLNWINESFHLVISI